MALFGFEFEVGDMVKSLTDAYVGRVMARDKSGGDIRYALDNGKKYFEQNLELLAKDVTPNLPTKRWYHRGK